MGHGDERIAAAATWLRGHAGAMEALLAALVSENSYTGNPEGGNRVGNLLAAHLSASGISIETRPSAAYADHLIFTSKAPGRPIALVGHLDTVFPPGSFEGYVRDGALARGPGVLDMKGGLVVVSYALLALAEVGALDELAFRFVVVSDEEVGSPEGQTALKDAAGDALCGLVFEAGRTGDQIVTRRKGVGGVTAAARGRAAHAGNHHEQGINAIWALARFVDGAQRLTDYARSRTVNVGKIQGGTTHNTVPEAARAELDIRFETTADGNALLAELSALASAAESEVPGSTVEVRGAISRWPMERSKESAALAAEYLACAAAAGLGSGEAPISGGGSDANTLSSLGIPCIDGLGPRGAGFHTSTEHIEVSSLVPKTEAVVRFLLGRVVHRE